jgi:sulfur-oxidizing protein SoxZ
MLGRVQVPPSVKRGDVLEVRVIVQHPMETGFRRDMNGREIPLNIVDRLACTYGGREVFRVEPGSGIAANPYFVFPVVATASGELAVEWSDDRGATGRVTVMVNVVAS